MGQYFEWLNIDKKETVGSFPWKCGVKLPDNTYVGNEKTDAVLTLLASRWKGDRVIFLGDYAEFENETDPYRRAFEEELAGGTAEDYIDGRFTDIAGIFSYVKTSSWPTYYDWETETDVPFDGPFDTEIVHYRFVVDETLHEYVDRTETPVRWIGHDGSIVRYDPVPELMSSETPISEDDDGIPGRWFMHQVLPANEPPGSNYQQIAQTHTYWTWNPVITARDEAIRQVIADRAIDLEKLDSSGILRQVDAALTQGEGE